MLNYAIHSIQIQLTSAIVHTSHSRARDPDSCYSKEYCPFLSCSH